MTDKAGRSVTLVDDGRPIAWRHPVILRIGAVIVALTALGIATAFVVTYRLSDLWVSGLLVLCAVLAARWGRSAITMDEHEITVVTTFRRRTFALADVVTAESDYYGLWIRLSGGTSIYPSVGSTWNVTRWLGLVSSGDRKAALILHRARVARGGDPGPITIVGRRSAGTFNLG